MLQFTGASAVSLLTIPAVAREEKDDKKSSYPFELPKLPYEFDALDAAIDAKTMEIHHDRHHKAYVDNLNNALKEMPDLQKLSLTELVTGLDKVPEKSRTAVRNNAGGHLNHSWFWLMMSKDGGGEPSGALGKAIDSSFESFSKFQDAFSKAALGRFGSGWAWLVAKDGKLTISSTPNQDNPIMKAGSGTPILGLDVWEHAYYLRYQNKRADYVKSWWKVVNWKFVAQLHEGAKG
jgi:Fe-Mn family superoxide dismutase